MSPSTRITVVGSACLLFVFAAITSGCSKEDKDKEQKTQAEPKPADPAAKPATPAPTTKPATQPPTASAPKKAAACKNERKPVVLEAGKAVSDAEDEGGKPVCAVWRVGGKEIVVHPVLVDLDEGAGDGKLVAAVDGKEHDVSSFGFNLATGTSYDWRLDDKGQLTFVANMGGSGRDPGTTYAMLLGWDDQAKAVKRIKEWSDEALADPPAWAKFD